MRSSMQRAAYEAERPKVVQLVANRAAGGHQVQRIAALAKAFERTGAQVVISECGPHCDFPLDPAADHLCVIGGDGTIRHAALAAATAKHTVPISFYPAGTINLVHREAPCDLDPDAYARRIVGRESERAHYAARLNDSLFLACASVGPDSAAVAQVSSRLKRWIGRFAYAVAFLRLLWRWPRHEIILCHDGKALRCEAFYVAKGRYFAGPWSFAPAARLDEPLLHVVAIKRCTRRAWLNFAWSLYRETPVDDVRSVVRFTCTKLSAEAAVPLPIQADGDIAATLPVTIEVLPEPIRFC